MSRHAREDAHGYTEFASVIAPRLFRSALLLCGDWQLAEDLVQGVLAKLFVSWRRVQQADSREAYAHGVLTKTYLSHCRARRNTELPSEFVADERVELPDHAERMDLLTVLAELDLLDRAVLVLRYWEDRSVAETARLLAMSEGAVRTRSSRALARLRAALTWREEAR